MSVSKRVYAEILEKATILKIFTYYRGTEGLKKVGLGWNTRYATTCPFHKEKTPSFFLFPNTGSFNCYGGCGGGTQIDLVRHFEEDANGTHFTYLQKLAEIASVTIPSGRTNLCRARRRVRPSTEKKIRKTMRCRCGTQPVLEEEKVPF